MVFRTSKRTSRAAASASRTAQVSRETRLSSDGCDMWKYSCGGLYLCKGIRLELQRGRKLATTTGGEPVHADARNSMLGKVHERTLAWPPTRLQARAAMA